LKSTLQFITGQWTIVERKYARFEKAPNPSGLQTPSNEKNFHVFMFIIL